MDAPIDNARYSLAARAFHWLMAAGFAFMWACGYAMTTLVADDSTVEELLFGLHISTGVTLLVLLAARIGVRLERTGARLGHVALYALPAAVIAVGSPRNWSPAAASPADRGRTASSG